jgi:hypothetical protein
VSPVAFRAFKALPRKDASPLDDETPKPILLSPPEYSADAPLPEPSFSVTPYATDAPQPRPLSVHTQHASDHSVSPFDFCETPKHILGTSFKLPSPLQPPQAPLPQRPDFDVLNSARTSTSPSPRLDPRGILARPLANDFADSAAEGSIGGFHADDASLSGDKLEPSLCTSFHAAEELAGQMATMQVC